MWSHEFAAEPVELLSEVGPDGYERRKVERFRYGRLGWADEDNEVGGTGLGEIPITSVAEINAQPEFHATTITAAQFDRVWWQAARA